MVNRGLDINTWSRLSENYVTSWGTAQSPDVQLVRDSRVDWQKWLVPIVRPSDLNGNAGGRVDQVQLQMAPP